MSSSHSLRYGKQFWCAMALAMTLAIASDLQAAATTMTLLLKDGAGAALSGRAVLIYKIDAGGFITRVGGDFVTDAGGRVVITGLDDKDTYYIKTLNDSGELVMSGAVAGAANTANVTVTSTVTAAAVTSSTAADSSTKSNGLNNNAPPEAPPAADATDGAGSTGDGSASVSAAITSYVVTVKDGITGAALPNVDVYAYQVNTAGGGDILQPNMPLTTNVSGQVTFATASGTSLNDSNIYYLRAKVFNNRWSNSESFRPTGALPSRMFLVGTLQVTAVDALVNPGNPVAQANLKVTLQRRPNGSATFSSMETLRTDANGQLKLNLQGLGFGFEYRMRVTYNSNVVLSDIFSNPGNYIFPVAGSIATPALTSKQKAHHAVNRLTFGMTPSLLDEINNAYLNGFNGSNVGDAGVDAWLADFVAKQIDSDTIPNIATEDSNLNQYLANYSTLRATASSGYTSGGLPTTANAWFRDGNSIVSTSNGTNDPNIQTPPAPAWVVSTFYPRNYVIKNNTASGAPDSQYYFCTTDHTSSSTDRPGDNANAPTWTSRWAAQNNTTSASYNGVIVPSTGQLQQLSMRRMYRTKRQLLEKVYWFWENHFNTDISADSKRHWEMQEQNMFRTMAFGKFLDLVIADGKGVNMLYYLNNNTNTKSQPNENYARELFELHVLGVDNGYNQNDIIQAARCFTGWQQNNTTVHTWNPTFFFNSTNHDTSATPKVVLGSTITNRTGTAGVNEGVDVMTLACNSDGAANFLAKKLVNFFITDTPDSNLLSRIATSFKNNRNNASHIKLVVTDIINDTTFYDPSNFRNKVKTPLLIAISMARNFTEDPGYPYSSVNSTAQYPPFGELASLCTNAGQGLFTYPFPTGWPEIGANWTSTNTTLWTNQIAFNFTRANNNRLGNTATASITDWMIARGILNDPEAILDYFNDLVLDGEMTGVERQMLRNCLNNGGPYTSLSTTSKKANLEIMCGVLMNIPSFLFH